MILWWPCFPQSVRKQVSRDLQVRRVSIYLRWCCLISSLCPPVSLMVMFYDIYLMFQDLNDEGGGGLRNLLSHQSHIAVMPDSIGKFLQIEPRLSNQHCQMRSKQKWPKLFLTKNVILMYGMEFSKIFIVRLWQKNKPGEFYLSTPTQFNFKHDKLSLSLSK